jgi:hypothetical protein
MDWTTIASLAVAWLGQALKSVKKFPTLLAQILTFAVAFAFYAVEHHYAATDGDWFRAGIVWSLAVIGASSMAGHAKLAPKTDSN